MELAANHSYGWTAGDNRRYWGGAENKIKTDGEEARGGERDARAGKFHWRERISVQGNLGGGREGGTRAIS